MRTRNLSLVTKDFCSSLPLLFLFPVLGCSHVIHTCQNLLFCTKLSSLLKPSLFHCDLRAKLINVSVDFNALFLILVDGMTAWTVGVLRCDNNSKRLEKTGFFAKIALLVTN